MLELRVGNLKCPWTCSQYWMVIDDEQSSPPISKTRPNAVSFLLEETGVFDEEGDRADNQQSVNQPTPPFQRQRGMAQGCHPYHQCHQPACLGCGPVKAGKTESPKNKDE